MVATYPINRIGYDSPPAALPELPKTARERGFLWSDVVFQAVLALRNQLTHRDSAVVQAAANSLIELERTRMRHSTDVAGSESVSTAQLEFEEDERETVESHAERRAERAEQAAPVQVEPSADDRALAGHAREAAEACVELGKPIPPRPEQFVSVMLEKWGLAPSEIPAGEFMRYLRKLGFDDNPASPPDPQASPLNRSSPHHLIA